MGEREAREKQFYDDLAVSASATRSLLDRCSEAFYEKGSQGRLWSSFWETADLKGATVLDYGCGNGQFSLLMACRGARVFGIDISPTLIAQARASAAKLGLNGRHSSVRGGRCAAHTFRRCHVRLRGRKRRAPSP